MTLRTIKEGLPDETTIEVDGPFLQGPVKRLLNEVKVGDILSFTCVKAKNKEKVFILQPLIIEVK